MLGGLGELYHWGIPLGSVTQPSSWPSGLVALVREPTHELRVVGSSQHSAGTGAEVSRAELDFQVRKAEKRRAPGLVL